MAFAVASAVSATVAAAGGAIVATTVRAPPAPAAVDVRSHGVRANSNAAISRHAGAGAGVS